jgi:hypothetical protein
MTERTERIIEVGDLVAIVVRCTGCSVSFQLDPRNDAQRDFALVLRDQTEPAPKLCPFCGHEFDRPTRVALGVFREFLHYAGLAQPGLQFRLADPGPVQSD